MMPHTPGPWTACRMVHQQTGEDMTPEQVGEYVANSVIKSAAVSGSMAFLFVSCEKEDGPADVCHVGNGPTSPANAKLIAAAPDLLAALKELMEDPDYQVAVGGNPSAVAAMLARARAAIVKAEGRS